MTYIPESVPPNASTGPDALDAGYPTTPFAPAPSTGTPAGGETGELSDEELIVHFARCVGHSVERFPTAREALRDRFAALRSELAEAQRDMGRGWDAASQERASKREAESRLAAQSQEIARLREGLSELREAVTQFQDAYYAGDDVGESMYRDLLTVAMENTAALAATPTTESDTDGR